MDQHDHFIAEVEKEYRGNPQVVFDLKKELKDNVDASPVAALARVLAKHQKPVPLESGTFSPAIVPMKYDRKKHRRPPPADKPKR